MTGHTESVGWRRREVLKVLAGAGVGSLVFQRALAAQVETQGHVTAEMIRQAEWIAGLELSDAQREEAVQHVQRTVDHLQALRAVKLAYEVPPATGFHPEPHQRRAEVPIEQRAVTVQAAPAPRPQSAEDLAFLPVGQLATLLRTGQVSSVDLTRLYLERLRRYDPQLLCVVSYTEELAMRQAEKADREIAAGRYRGPLHGVPWGAKDLIAYPGYKTTWGAAPFQDQVLDVKATVARRLDEAGAVLVAKLSLGALAWGDQWFRGRTRNPWNVEQRSGGSSAGSAAATAAGLVGFSLGSETMGSIIAPCRRCGATGLRPTFGRISRHGCMPLAWSLDKIGPITRSVEDCALVLAAIHGSDRHDDTALNRPFHWPSRRPLHDLRVGYFEQDEPVSEREELRVLAELGVQLVPVELPDDYPVDSLLVILNCESATVFDELARKGVTDGLNRWPAAFHQGQLTPAVEYLRANRIRTLLMQRMRPLMDQVDLYVGGDDLILTNLTGHPTVVLPNGFQKDEHGVETPTALTFTGRLFGESELLAVCRAYQQATGHHLRRPPLDA